MHIHILGICGTFMGGIALLAQKAGHKVTGSDSNVYPPMSTQLEEQGIGLMEGYDAAHLDPKPDFVVVGNALTRGNPAVEYVLNENIPYISGPQWLSEYVLQEHWVLAVAGTHGKTSTSSILAWILEHAGLNPGFLIGGIPGNFGVSARSGDTPFFVVEADEYDSAFFDKRSKFVHYRPKTLILNNLEYDHADIFPNLDAIKTQFHHLVRTVPANGLIVTHQHEHDIKSVLKMGCWTPVVTIGSQSECSWSFSKLKEDGSHFSVFHNREHVGDVDWSLTGDHNIYNAMSAIAAAHHAGVDETTAIDALTSFKGIKRRMELIGNVNNIKIYDDFAHHPTAITTTLNGLREHVGNSRIIAILEPRSNTMRMGVHQNTLAPSLSTADHVLLYDPHDLGWNLQQVASQCTSPCEIFSTVDQIIAKVVKLAQKGDHIIIMSNGGFGGIHQKLVDELKPS